MSNVLKNDTIFCQLLINTCTVLLWLPVVLYSMTLNDLNLCYGRPM